MLNTKDTMVRKTGTIFVYGVYNLIMERKKKLIKCYNV